MRIEDLIVYRRLCELHIKACALTNAWPSHERFELGSQVRRSSNSAPAQLAEKNSDRHVRNKVEGVIRARGESLETVHHLFVARMKGYITEVEYQEFREGYQECVRMLNGLERSLEKKLPERERRYDDPATDLSSLPPTLTSDL